MSKNLVFRILLSLITKSKEFLVAALNEVIKVCKKGFYIKCVDSDRQFEYLENSFDSTITDLIDLLDHTNLI